MPISEPEAAKTAIMPLYAWAAVGEMLPAVVPVIPTSALRAFRMQFRCTVVFNHYKPNARAKKGELARDVGCCFDIAKMRGVQRTLWDFLKILGVRRIFYDR